MMTSTGRSAWRHAIAWIAPFMPPWRMRSSTARGIADQVVFLCSVRGRTISGQAISICGDTQMLP